MALFTPEELEEIRRADAEIDAEFRMRTEDYQLSESLDEACKPKKKYRYPEWDRAYYQRNRERILARNKKYQQEHREQIKETKRRYYQKNKAYLNARDREYRAKRAERNGGAL